MSNVKKRCSHLSCKTMAELQRKRNAILQLHLHGKTNSEICKVLKSGNVTRCLVYRTVKRYKDTGTVEDRPRSGRPRDKRTPRMLKALKNRIKRNPRRCQKKLALQMNVSRQTMQRALKKDLKLKALKRGTCHMLTMQQKKNRLLRCRALLRRYGPEDVKSILFTDEKIFTVEEKFNKQNDRAYAQSVKDIPIRQRKSLRAHHPGYVMAWAGVSWAGKAKLHFCTQGVKVKARNYKSYILEPVVKPLSQTLFRNRPWTFQQGSAPAHGAKTTQKWLEDSVPDFISKDEWSSASPVLKPLDYSIWSKLEQKVCCKPHTSRENLKKALLREWDRFPMESIRTAIENWRPRLQACVKAKGGHFEQ